MACLTHEATLAYNQPFSVTFSQTAASLWEMQEVTCHLKFPGASETTECTKIARFSSAAAAILTAPKKIGRSFEAPRCAISSAKKIASEPRFLLRIKWVKMVLAAEFPAIPSSAAKIASERQCAILVHSVLSHFRLVGREAWRESERLRYCTTTRHSSPE